MMHRWQWRIMSKILLVLFVFLHTTITPLSAFRPKDQSCIRSMHGRFVNSIIGNDQKYPCVTTRKPLALGMFPPLPSSYEYDEEVVFLQRATQTRISGKDKLEKSIAQWEEDFRDEVDKGKDTSYYGSRIKTKRSNMRPSHPGAEPCVLIPFAQVISQFVSLRWSSR